jgi:hypothetical protein
MRRVGSGGEHATEEAKRGHFREARVAQGNLLIWDASEGVDNVLFETVDEIVPVQVPGRGKVGALEQNQKRNEIELKSPASPQISRKRASRGVDRSRKVHSQKNQTSRDFTNLRSLNKALNASYLNHNCLSRLRKSRKSESYQSVTGFFI